MFVDVETGVNTAVRKVRKALCDSPGAFAFIETVPGRGYRFIADVEVMRELDEVLAHYQTLGVQTMRASVPAQIGLEELRTALRDHTTVLAGHSGVGKSSLIRAIQPALDLRIGAISWYTGKGRHTTTSARHYPLDIGGAVIDTPLQG